MGQDRPIIHIGAYGTGTNWICRTLESSGVQVYNSNFQANTPTGRPQFFKHYVVEGDTLEILSPPSDALYICIVKDPFFWIKSLRAMVCARIMPAREMSSLDGVDLSTFIRASGTMVGARREHGPDEAARVRYRNLPDFWNRYARGYLDFLPIGDRLVLRYEDVIADPKRCFGEMLHRAGRSRGAFEIHRERRFQDDTKPGVGRDFLEARSYYCDERNRLAEFDDEDIDFIDQTIDRDLRSRLGYGPGSTRSPEGIQTAV